MSAHRDVAALERAVRRALAGGESRAGEIAERCGCSRQYVARIALRIRREEKQSILAVLS